MKPSITEKLTSICPNTYPVSISHTANKDKADRIAENSLTLSLNILSWSVLRILSTPGYASFDLNPSIRNWRRCLADILANKDEKCGGKRRIERIEKNIIATSTDEYSHFVNITPADAGAAIENQNRIEGMYLIVEILVQNFLCESILAILFE